MALTATGFPGRLVGRPDGSNRDSPVMRIVNAVLGDATGGRWQVVLDYARVLTESGHQVLLLVNSREVKDELALPAGVELAKVRNSGHYDPLATLVAWRLFQRFQPDVVIAHCSRSLALLKRAARGRAPVVGVCHSNNVRRMATADAHFNISTHIGSMISALTPSNHPAYHLPNMVQFDPAVSYVPRNFQQTPVIGAFGRFDPVKGFDVLLRALGLLRDRGLSFHCKLGGGGVQEQELRVLSEELKLGPLLEFVGWVRARQAFFDGIDVCCIPSRSDAFGITPLETAIAGVPQVLSTADGHRDMFEDGVQAYFAGIDQPDELANALTAMLTDSKNAQIMAQRAFDRVKSRYAEPVFRDNLNRALADVAKRFGNHR